MAGDAAEMEAMMAQMQAANGGGMGGMGQMGQMGGMGGRGGNHKKRQSNMSLSGYSVQELQNKQHSVDLHVEIEDYRAEKDLLMKAYDDIDLDDNGDIEQEEFEEGMKRLNVSLTEAEITQIFKLMDSDASNYVDRSEFTMFLTQRFESTELTRFQDAILRKLGGRTRKSISGAIHDGDAAEMDQVAISAMEREMRQQMNEMANEEIVILKEEEKLYAELEKQEDEQQNFGDIENAAEWNRFEVAHWIDTEVKLNEYMTAFMKNHVDGSILLNDLGREFLMDIGVKRVHVDKVMRAIVGLRDKIRKEWDESECMDVIPTILQYDERATDKIEELKGEISKRDEQIENLRKDYEARIAALCKTIEDKEAIIAKAEEDGFIFDDDGKDGDDDSNYSDSVGIDDDDMPPLIDAHQQTVAYFGDGQAPNADIMTSQIQERHSGVVQFEDNQPVVANPTDSPNNDDDDNNDETTETQSADNDENKEKDDFEIVDNPTTDETVTETKEDGASNSLPVDVIQPPSTTVMKPAIPEDKLLSHSPSPNLTPSASQINLQQQKSTGSVGSASSSKGRGRKHHRKNSTKTGFWNSVQGGPKKKPPTGTKAYWMYLDQKHNMNANFAHPKRVIQWHHHEIAWWLKSIKCEKYANKFVEEKVSGEQLIYDMSTTVLSTDLGVKMLWCGKLMREIKALKIAAGLQYSIEDKVNVATYRPSNEESITKQMEELQTKLNETEELHTEELKEKDERFEELKQENDKLKTEIETLEKQVVELEKRKAKKSDDSDTDEDDDDDDDYIPLETNNITTTNIETEETKEQQQEQEQEQEQVEENGDDNDNAQIIDAPITQIPAPVNTGTTGKRPKGYFRKYPKEIRKVMRQIDDMERRSNDGEYGQNNRGKFGATNRAFKWNQFEVCHWLNKRGFVSYIKQFNDNGIDGEILVNDLNPTILHEDLEVKRFHTGKMLREIQVLRQGGLYTESECIDIGYEAKFSASEEIANLTKTNEEMASKLEEKEKQVEELTSRPQIADDEKIVKIQQWEDLNEEKGRLAKQVDELEEKMDDLKTNAIPEQLKEEAKAQLMALTQELQEKKESDENFGNVINCRKWTTDEVSWFFVSIGLSDYVQGIRSAKINGEIFLEDTSPDMLSSDIGVKRIHINQIMRQVQDLKHRAFGYEECENVIDLAFIPEIYATEVIEGFEKKVDGLEDEIKKQEEKYDELNNKYQEIEKEKETLITEKNGLLENIDTLNKNIQDLKDQGQQEMEESARAKIEELNTEIQGLNKTITDNKESYDEEKKEIETENIRVIEEKDTNITQLNTKIEQLETDLNDANNKIEEFMEKERIAREEEEAKDNSYEAQLRRMAKNDPTFGVPKMAHKWSMEEVSHWLYTIKVPDYVESFKDKLVDGTILLSDLSPEQLRSELQIKQYHIGKISREIAKLKELAIPPLAESDIICDQSYIPDKPAIEVIRELTDQKDINAALNMELERVNNKLSTLEEIQAIGAGDIEITKGGPNDPELKEELAESNENNNNNNNNNQNSSSSDPINNEQVEALKKENKELNQTLEYLQKSKIDLAMQTATEMQKLRSMVRVASQAYEELTGTPLGQVAQWPSTQNFFYNTLGYNSSIKHNNNNNNNNNNIYR